MDRPWTRRAFFVGVLFLVAAATYQQVEPTPMAPRRPYKVTLAGAASACLKLPTHTSSTAPSRVEVDCTVDCQWDVDYAYPDAGFEIPAQDGGLGAIYAETTDGNQLPAATPRVATLPVAINGTAANGVCFYSSSAGLAYVSETY